MAEHIINVRVNGHPYEVAVEPHWTLETVRETVIQGDD